MGPLEAVKSYFKKYANFTGRASRSEFWFVILFLIIGSVILSILSSIVNNILLATILNSTDALGIMYYFLAFNPIWYIVGLALLVPTLSLTVRRLHDMNRNGGLVALVLIPFIGPLIVLIFTVLPGTYGPNRYGEMPN